MNGNDVIGMYNTYVKTGCIVQIQRKEIKDTPEVVSIGQ